MKRIIDIPEPSFNACKLWVEMGVANWEDEIIANSIPYEERQLSHEQECIIEELENICINNEYVLDLLAKLKNEETPKGGKEE